MKISANRTITAGRWFAIFISLVLAIFTLPVQADHVSAQGIATIAIQALDADGVTPLPFARFQVVDSNGVDYGKRETGFSGTTSFAVTPGPDVTFTVTEETVPACGIAPEAQIAGPLTDTESVQLDFVTQFDPNCNLGTLAAYRYTCPESFDTEAATSYEDWSVGCSDEINGVAFEFTSVATDQTWQPVSGDYGISGRAPIVGLPPGDYTMEQVEPLGDKVAAWYCLTYDTPNYNTSPNPTDISLLDSPDGVVEVSLNGNRVSCDLFVAPAPEAPSEPTVAPVGTAITTSDVNVRAEPDASSDILGVLLPGETVDVLGEPQNGFHPVRFDGTDGWVSSQFLQTGDEPVEPTETEEVVTETAPAEPTVAPIGTAQVTSDVNLRDAPNLDSNVIGVVLPGQFVEVLGEPQNGFWPVRYDGQDGWVSDQFVDTSPGDDPATETATSTPTVPPPTETTQPDPTIAPVGTAQITSDVNLRDAPNLESNVLDVLLPGESVELLGESQNGFYPVRSNGQDGWVSEQYVNAAPDDGPASTETPTSTPTVADPTAEPVGTATTTSEVNMRSEPDITSDVVQVLAGGVEVEILGEPQNGFSPVRYDNQDGWVSETFLSSGVEPADVSPTTEPLASVELHKAVCEPGYEPGSQIFVDCHEEGAADVTFFIEGPDSFSDSAVTTLPSTPGPGVAVFEDLVTGSYTINEDVPGDFTSIFVFCSVAGTGTPAPFTYNEAVQGIDIDIEAGTELVCDWYNILDVQEPETGTVQVVKRTCEEGYDATTATFNDFINDCPSLTDGVTFGLVPDGIAETPTKTTGDDAFGTAVFGDVFLGVHFLTERTTGANVAAYAYCGPDLNNLSVAPITDKSVVVEPTSQNPDVYCLWFNVPEAPPAETGTLELHKLQCAPGLVPTESIYDDCHDSGLAGVTFFIDGPDNFQEQASTTIPQTPGPGVAAFGDLEAGSYSISEDVPAETTSIFVFCSLADSDTIIPFDYRQDIQGIDIEIGEGQYVICDWYNIPDPPQTGTVEVIKRVCPVGYDAGEAGFSDFITDCPTLQNGETFGLVPDGIAETPTRVTGDDSAGTARFTDVYLGLHSLWEQSLDEFTTPYAYCGADLGNLSAVPIDNGRTAVEPTSQNPNVYCLWFNVPEDQTGEPGSISFSKFLCPEGTTGNYWANCSPNPLQNATFAVDGPHGYEASLLTGPTGEAVFSDLDAGNYVIQEIPPAGVDVAVYVVACQAGGASYKFTYDDSNGMKIRLAVPPGGEIHCNWYNVPRTKEVKPPPVTPSDSGSITVHKYLCSGKARTAYTWSTDCLVETGGAAFEISTSTGSPIANGTTNSSGLLVFSGLSNGAYGLEETSGDWCHAEADRVDATGNVIVGNGGNTDVFIYNCSTGNVGSLPSTGVGSTDAGGLWPMIIAVIAGVTALAGSIRLRRTHLAAPVADRRPCNDYPRT